jgi:hypothetical protein
MKVAALLVAAREGGAVLLTAPPASGKSSLGKLVRAELNRQRVPFTFVSCLRVKTDELTGASLGDLILPFQQNLVPSYVIVDDVQLVYHYDFFWQQVKDACGNRETYNTFFIFLATFGEHRLGSDTTPWTFPRRFYGDFLTATSAEMDELFDDYDLFVSQFTNIPKLSDSLRSMIRNLSGGQLAHIAEMVYFVYEHSHKGALIDYDEATVIQLLFDEQFLDRIRALRNYIKPNVMSVVERQLVLELLNAEEPFRVEDTTQWLSLIKKGVVTEQESCLRFSSRNARVLYMMYFKDAKVRAPQEPTNLQSFVKEAIARFSYARLMKNFTKRQGETKNRLKEAAWQSEFYHVGVSLLPVQHTLSPEVSRVFNDSVHQDAVDFYVNGSLRWMIEFTSESDRLQEHLDRFLLGGKYQNLPRKDWLIVNFTSKQPQASTINMHDNFWHVMYNPEDMSSVTVYCKSAAPFPISLTNDDVDVVRIAFSRLSSTDH